MQSNRPLPAPLRRGLATLPSRCLLVFAMLQLMSACSTEPGEDDTWPAAHTCEADMTCEDLTPSTPGDMQATGSDMSTYAPDMRAQPDQGNGPIGGEQDMDPPPSCQGGDGTCPAGCDLSNDADCIPDCQDASTWPADYAEREAKLLSEINAARAQGANCGSKGSFPPASPVQMNASLQIAARCHSVDMVERIGKLDHTGSDGSSFSQRAKREGYTGSPAGENIAAGNGTAEATIRQWMNSDGHCANIMKANIDRIGTGYFKGDIRYTHYWTLVTGKGGGQ